MYRTNTPADVANTGRARIDTGDGVTVEVPVIPSPPPYDSGLRDITSLIVAGTAPWVRLSRAGSTVELYVNNWDGTGVPANTTILTLPPGFRPRWTRRITSSSSTGYPYIETGGALKYNGTPGTTVLQAVYLTADAPPTTPPGSNV